MQGEAAAITGEWSIADGHHLHPAVVEVEARQEMCAEESTGLEDRMHHRTPALAEARQGTSAEGTVNDRAHRPHQAPIAAVAEVEGGLNRQREGENPHRVTKKIGKLPRGRKTIGILHPEVTAIEKIKRSAGSENMIGRTRERKNPAERTLDLIRLLRMMTMRTYGEVRYQGRR